MPHLEVVFDLSYKDLERATIYKYYQRNNNKMSMV